MTSKSIDGIVPSALTAVFVVCLLGLWASLHFGAPALGKALYVAAIILLGALDLLSFVAAAAAGLGYFKDYWSSGYPAMTLVLMVLWGLWRCDSLLDVAVFTSGVILSFVALLGFGRGARWIMPLLAVSSFDLAGLIPLHMAELIVLSVATGVFVGAIWPVSREQLEPVPRL